MFSMLNLKRTWCSVMSMKVVPKDGETQLQGASKSQRRRLFNRKPDDLMIKPTTDNRYDARQFHVGMFNEWTNAVCDEHPHLLHE